MRKIKTFLPVLLIALCGALLFTAFASIGKTAADETPVYTWTSQGVDTFNATPTSSGNTVKIDLTGYAIVTSGATAAYKAYAQKLAERIEELTGVDVPVRTTSFSQKAIYIGASNGPCTQALKGVNSDCAWAIKVVGKNIALAGTTNALALEAVDYFIATFLTGDGLDATITMSEKYVYTYATASQVVLAVAPTKTVTAVTTTVEGVSNTETTTTYGDNAQNSYAVIYPNGLDVDGTYYHSRDPENEYSYTNMTYLKDTDVSTYELLYLDSTDQTKGAWVKDTSRDNSSHGTKLTYDEQDRILVNGDPIFLPYAWIDDTTGGTHGFFINNSGQVEFRESYPSGDETKINKRAIQVNGLSSGVGTGRDYVYDRAYNIYNTLANITMTKSTLDDDTATATTYEILIGDTSREESAQLLALLDKNEYGIAVIGNKIVATGWSVETQQYAAQLLCEMLNGYASITEQEITNTSTKDEEAGTEIKTKTTVTDQRIILPNDFCLIACADDNLISATEHPLPSTVTLTDVVDEGDGSMLYLYRTNVTKSAYDTYCSTLASAGYELLTESTLNGSYFKTFVNYQTGISLLVSYNAFAGVDQYTPDTGTNLNATGNADFPLYEDYFAYTDPQIRIISSKLTASPLPEDSLLNPTQEYVKVTESAITSIDLSLGKNSSGTVVSSYGTGFVMLLENGKFIVIDGGANAGVNDEQADNIYNIMADLHQKAFGTAPSTSNPIEIAAWIVTHNHGDHTYAFRDFAKKYGKGVGTGMVTMDYLFANFPSQSICYNTAEANTDMPNLITTLKGYLGDFTYVEVHTGQTLYLANLTIETLYTVEDLYPQRLVTYNDSSAVMRLTFRSTGAADNAQVTIDNTDSTLNKTSFISTGDAYIHTGRWLASMYGTALKADMVSLAHHGGVGIETAFYDLVAPSTVWWSMSRDAIYSESTTTTTGSWFWQTTTTTWDSSGYMTQSAWNALVDQYVVFMLDSVRYVYIADEYNITVWLNGGTAQQEAGQLYAASGSGTGTISYNSNAMPTKNDKATTLSKDSYKDFLNEKAVALKKD